MSKELDKNVNNNSEGNTKTQEANNSRDGKIIEMPVDMFKDASTKKADLDKKVTRRELIEIIHQIGDNINDISQYLMQDLNTLYSTHVFPFQIQLKVLEDMLIESGAITREDLDKRYTEHIRQMQEKARALKEEKDGEVRLATPEEDKIETSKKVLEVLNDSKKDESSED